MENDIAFVGDDRHCFCCWRSTALLSSIENNTAFEINPPFVGGSHHLSLHCWRRLCWRKSPTRPSLCGRKSPPVPPDPSLCWRKSPPPLPPTLPLLEEVATRPPPPPFVGEVATRPSLCWRKSPPVPPFVERSTLPLLEEVATRPSFLVDPPNPPFVGGSRHPRPSFVGEINPPFVGGSRPAPPSLSTLCGGSRHRPSFLVEPSLCWRKSPPALPPFLVVCWRKSPPALLPSPFINPPFVEESRHPPSFLINPPFVGGSSHPSLLPQPSLCWRKSPPAPPSWPTLPLLGGSRHPSLLPGRSTLPLLEEVATRPSFLEVATAPFLVDQPSFLEEVATRPSFVGGSRHPPPSPCRSTLPLFGGGRHPSSFLGRSTLPLSTRPSFLKPSLLEEVATRASFLVDKPSLCWRKSPPALPSLQINPPFINPPFVGGSRHPSLLPGRSTLPLLEEVATAPLPLLEEVAPRPSFLVDQPSFVGGSRHPSLLLVDQPSLCWRKSPPAPPSLQINPPFVGGSTPAPPFGGGRHPPFLKSPPPLPLLEEVATRLLPGRSTLPLFGGVATRPLCWRKSATRPPFVGGSRHAASFLVDQPSLCWRKSPPPSFVKSQDEVATRPSFLVSLPSNQPSLLLRKSPPALLCWRKPSPSFVGGSRHPSLLPCRSTLPLLEEVATRPSFLCRSTLPLLEEINPPQPPFVERPSFVGESTRPFLVRPSFVGGVNPPFVGGSRHPPLLPGRSTLPLLEEAPPATPLLEKSPPALLPINPPFVGGSSHPSLLPAAPPFVGGSRHPPLPFVGGSRHRPSFLVDQPSLYQPPLCWRKSPPAPFLVITLPLLEKSHSFRSTLPLLEEVATPPLLPGRSTLPLLEEVATRPSFVGESRHPPPSCRSTPPFVGGSRTVPPSCRSTLPLLRKSPSFLVGSTLPLLEEVATAPPVATRPSFLVDQPSLCWRKSPPPLLC
ncbi:hypothetical protein C7M84_007409 [Penaeus vannamei]|uniref:Uncharacterized protein n=1 Tax=Penaeus vannamei TaxID=6689 RepID=A0A423TC73_PENVA|nr:hypothetical protein C7M84_007409 [Penaeus vannamei]